MGAPFLDGLGNNHVLGTSDASALDDGLPHSPGAEDQHRGTGPDLCRIEDCTDTGLHGATDHASDVERRVVGNLDRATRRNDGLFGKGADAESSMNEVATQAERRCPIGAKVVDKGERLSALRPRMASARAAFAARRERGEHDLVASTKMRYSLPHLGDLTCRLVPEHNR